MLATEFDLQLLEEIWKEDYRIDHIMQGINRQRELVESGYTFDEAREIIFKEEEDRKKTMASCWRISVK